jgi:hypothetical protein
MMFPDLCKAQSAFASPPVIITIEPMGIAPHHREVCLVDVVTVEIWRRRRNAEVRI